MRKILFLDIDGVVNSHAYRKEPKHSRGAYGTMCSCGEIDPLLVEKLNAILQGHPDTEVVLSSAWRYDETPPSMTMTLQHRGFRYVVTDSTPRTSDERLTEIALWWATPFYPSEPVAFVVLDDLIPTVDAPWCVCTSAWVGLTDEDVVKAKAALGTPVTQEDWALFIAAAFPEKDEEDPDA